jgi:hypothetical protein
MLMSEVFKQKTCTIKLNLQVFDRTVFSAVPSATSEEIVLDFLPEKPTPLPESADSVLQWVGDPPLESLGLASWSRWNKTLFRRQRGKISKSFCPRQAIPAWGHAQKY